MMLKWSVPQAHIGGMVLSPLTFGYIVYVSKYTVVMLKQFYFTRYVQLLTWSQYQEGKVRWVHVQHWKEEKITSLQSYLSGETSGAFTRLHSGSQEVRGHLPSSEPTQNQHIAKQRLDRVHCCAWMYQLLNLWEQSSQTNQVYFYYLVSCAVST